MFDWILAMLSVAGAGWRHKSARSRFGRPKGARRGCAREGAQQKSGAISASTGEKCGLETLLIQGQAGAGMMATFVEEIEDV